MMLPGFDTIADEKRARTTEERMDAGIRYYLRIQTLKGDWMYFWGNDPVAGCMWVKESHIDKIKPRLYKTTMGAMRMLEHYTSNMVLESKKVAVYGTIESHA